MIFVRTGNTETLLLIIITKSFATTPHDIRTMDFDSISGCYLSKEDFGISRVVTNTSEEASNDNCNLKMMQIQQTYSRPRN